MEYVGELLTEGVAGRVVIRGVLEVVIEFVKLNVGKGDTVLVTIFVEGIEVGEIVNVTLVHPVIEKIVLDTL